jgi:predicted CXXCH cytochrome family protein
MKNSYLTILILVILGLLSGASCYYDRLDEIHPMSGSVNTCDTSIADTYNGAVNPIMQENCVSCHSSSNSSGNVALDNYTGVQTVASNGSLMGCINHTGGHNAMPPLTTIQSCEANRLQQWIKAGMPQ